VKLCIMVNEDNRKTNFGLRLKADEESIVYIHDAHTVLRIPLVSK
jgi:hypothetical protein